MGGLHGGILMKSRAQGRVPGFFMLLLVLVTSLGSCLMVYAVDEEDVRSELRVSFEAEAERRGGARAKDYTRFAKPLKR
jgi:hypothetical protein